MADEPHDDGRSPAPISIRGYRETDAGAVRDLFVRVNRLLAPVAMRDVFESYIERSLREEIGRIADYYAPAPGRGFWVAESAAGTLQGMFGLEPAAADGLAQLAVELAGQVAAALDDDMQFHARGLSRWPPFSRGGGRRWTPALRRDCPRRPPPACPESCPWPAPRAATPTETLMEQTRLDFYKASPAAMKPLLALSAAVADLGLEESLLELVKTRASQINGCAFCLDMHTADARRKGESERRLHALPAWRETPFFTPRERAALAWTEAVTLVAETHVPAADHEALCAEFSEKERVDLTLAICTINSWNRLAVAFRKMPPA